jgi:hypothetical protein
MQVQSSHRDKHCRVFKDLKMEDFPTREATATVSATVVLHGANSSTCSETCLGPHHPRPSSNRAARRKTLRGEAARALCSPPPDQNSE